MLPNSITNRQLSYMLILTVTCYSVVVLPKESVEASGTGAWIPIIAMAVIFGLAAALIVYLNNLFEEKNLFTYAPLLITKPGAYVVAIYYILYFLLLMVFLVSEQAKLVKADFLPKTPLWATQLLGIGLFCAIANKGLTNVARMAEIFGVVFIITAVSVHAIMAMQGDLNRILPLFDQQEINNYLKGMRPSYFALIPPSILLVIPMTRQNGRRSIRTAFTTMILIGLFLCFCCGELYYEAWPSRYSKL